MSKAVDNLNNAFQFAMRIRPKICGFPYLAEALRKAGVEKNIWNLPSCQSVYLTRFGPVVSQGSYLVNATVDIPCFDRDAVIQAIRADQAGQTSFPEFLAAIWDAGVVHYVVDFEKRVVNYYGVLGEFYAEEYPAVDISHL